jgi:hypothetical protein
MRIDEITNPVFSRAFSIEFYHIRVLLKGDE